MTSVPAVRQPSHGCASGSIAAFSARTTTGCCWRMRSSIRFIGSSKDRSSRKSEKSKPSSSLTGTKTASIGNSLAVAAAADELDRAGHPRRLAEVEELAPGLAGGRQRAADQRLEEALRRGSSSAGWSNSSSAGSDHLETDPWPSVRTKYPLTIWRRSASSASTGPAVSAITASAVSEAGWSGGSSRGSPERQAWGGFSSLIGRRSHSSNRVAAARESSDAVPPA